MKSILPSFEEIRVLAQVEQLYEQYRHRLAQPLHVKVTDAAGEITEYEYCPESDEELNTFRASASPDSGSFRLPVMIHITDAKGTCVVRMKKFLRRNAPTSYFEVLPEG